MKTLKPHELEDTDDSGSTGSTGSSGGARRFPSINEGGSYLVDESFSMEMQRRELEQQGQRKLARVHVVEHSEPPTNSAGHEGDLQNHIRQHPFLDKQRFDGIDPNVNPEPPLNSEARREFDNQKREQDKEKQLRLGNMPKFGNTIKPAPP